MNKPDGTFSLQISTAVLAFTNRKQGRSVTHTWPMSRAGFILQPASMIMSVLIV